MICGTTAVLQMLQGQARGSTVTVTPADGISRLTLSSTARLWIVTLPVVAGVHV